MAKQKNIRRAGVKLDALPLFLLRVALGWLFFYAGITKVLNPAWSAAGYLNNAKSFPGFFHWLAQPDILPIVNFLNEWGLLLIGACLILGLFVRWSAWLGVLLMLLYYSALPFPYPNANSLIVDEHIVYALALILLASLGSSQWSLENRLKLKPMIKEAD